jgi:YbgC/YbaW family acyl-CoA thioester hydrolase
MAHVSRARHRVRSYELDSYGHVNNAVYMQWLEHGRSRLLQDNGFSYNNIEDHWGVRLVLVSTRIDFRKSLMLDDDVEITTTVQRLGTTSVTFDHKVWRHPPSGEAELSAEAVAVIVFTDAGMEGPRPVPEPFKDLYGPDSQAV